jgi:hypothetical protein
MCVSPGMLQPDDFPCSGLVLPHSASSLNWKYFTFYYKPNNEFYGFDSLKIYAMDADDTYSDIVTVTFAAMESKCANDVMCTSKHCFIDLRNVYYMPF